MLNGSDVGQLRRCQERTWHILRSASSRSADFSSLLHRCPSRAARNAPERHVAQIHCPCFFNFLYESSCIAHSATVFTRHAANEESAGHNLQHAVGRTRGGTARYQYAVEKPTGTRRRGPGSHAPRCSLDARLEAGIRRGKGRAWTSLQSPLRPGCRLSLPVRARTNASRRAETPSTIMTQIRRHFGEKRQERR